MENSDEANPISKLREWSILNDVLAKVPAKLQRGIFYSDVNLTCVDVLTDFIALGTDVGIVFWYNRCNGNMIRLKCEVNNSFGYFMIIIIIIVDNVYIYIVRGMPDESSFTAACVK